MGQSTKEAYGAVGRSDLLWFEPTQLTIVDDPNHPLYDERIKLPLVPGIVASIKRRGVKKPVSVRKEADRVLVVDGRQRVRHAIQANQELLEEGSDPDSLIRIPAFVEKATDLEAVSIISNEFNQVDPIIVKARKAQRLRERGHEDQEVCEIFGVSQQTLDNWTLLISLPLPIQRKVENGVLSPTLGYELGKLPPAEATARLTAIEASNGALKGEAGVQNVRQPTGAKPKTQRETRTNSPAKILERIRHLSAILEPSETEPYEDTNIELVHLVLSVLLGDDPTAAGLREFPDIRKHVRKALKG